MPVVLSLSLSSFSKIRNIISFLYYSRRILKKNILHINPKEFTMNTLIEKKIQSSQKIDTVQITLIKVVLWVN